MVAGCLIPFLSFWFDHDYMLGLRWLLFPIASQLGSLWILQPEQVAVLVAVPVAVLVAMKWSLPIDPGTRVDSQCLETVKHRRGSRNKCLVYEAERGNFPHRGDLRLEVAIRHFGQRPQP